MAGISEFVNAGNVSPQAPQLAPIGNNKMLVPGALGLVAIAILVVGILIFFRFPTAQPFTEKVENAPLIDTQSVSIPVEVSREQATPSIAVLPFVNMSSDPEQEFFSDGITDDILNSLVRKTDLRVIARTSSFQFKNKNLDVREIGDALNVTHILEGSVRKIGNSIPIFFKWIISKKVY